jgi:DDE family transposase
VEDQDRPATAQGFQLLPRRWVVERTFAWFGRCRRLSRDFEGSTSTEVAWLLVAHLSLSTRRLAIPSNYRSLLESDSEDNVARPKGVSPIEWPRTLHDV